MVLDEHLNQATIEHGQMLVAPAVAAAPRLAVDWAPAYELLLSVDAYLNAKRHPLLELGPLWASAVHEQLPAAMATTLARKSTIRTFKDDNLLRLVYACPDKHDIPTFLAWFGQLTAGAAYEALASFAPEPGPQLPRDFAAWRDAVLDILGVWHTVYFRHLDPLILSGLLAQAEQLRARLGTSRPLELVEDVTNGMVAEPGPTLRHVTLIPQYHHRPYNTDVPVHDGVLILYPSEALPAAPDQVPARLMRLTRALADESRLRMLRFLANGPASLTEVARFAGLSQPTVHHHLVQLRTAGLIRVHFSPAAANRYSLRPHALEQLSQQLQAYLEVTDA